jgi:transposase InsO family protein
LPGTQLAADTTDLSACGVPLKLIAAQDIGDRHNNLLQSVIVDDHESADLVVKVLTEAIDDKPGQQVLTDQGTPYMAQATRKALEQLEAEHAPQKEGHPQGKATVERAFGTVKQIAGPLLDLTNRIARVIPALKNPDLAKAVATLVLTTVLKAYQAGARAAVCADNARAEISSDELADLAELSREKARAEARSHRLLLAAIHRDYNIQQPKNAFIRAMGRFPLNVLKQAEQDFSMQVHRDDIRDRAAYFAAIVRRLNQPHLLRLAADRIQREQDRQRDIKDQQVQAMHKNWRDQPQSWLYDAMMTLARQWNPVQRQLLFGGTGPAKQWLCDAIDTLIEQHGPTAAIDIAKGTFRQLEKQVSENIGPAGCQALLNLLETTWEQQSKNKFSLHSPQTPITLINKGPQRHPPPSGPC